MRRSTNAEVRLVRATRPDVSGRSCGRWWAAAVLLATFLAAVEVPTALASPPFKPPPRRRARAARVAPIPAHETPPAPPVATAEAAMPARIERVRYQADDHTTRVIVLLSRSVPYEVRVLPGERSRGSERRVVLDFSNAKLGSEATSAIGVEDGLLKQIRTGQFTARTARVVLDMASVTGHHVSELDDPPRVVVDIAGRPEATARDTKGSETPARDTAPIREPAIAPDGAAKHEEAPPRATPPSRVSDRPAETIAETRPASQAAAHEPERSLQPEAAPSALPPAPASPADGTGARAPRRVPEKPGLAGTVTSRTPARESAAAERAPAADAASVRPPAGVTGTDTAGVEVATREQSTAPETSRAPAIPPRSTPWRIVLDPGHGGNDPGTLGVDGVLEKNVTLTIAKRLKRRLEEGIGAQVLLTRDRDATRSLAERTAFANASNADVFVSIHANADAAGELHGVETYTLNNTNDRAAIRLAKMENGPGVRTGRGDLSFILSDMVQSGKEEDSIALANRLQQHLLYRLRSHYPDVRNLGVKKGPFYVLVGAYMPCVLVETSFLSHPVEGRRLASVAYQAEVVEGLYLGMADFLGDARLAKTL